MDHALDYEKINRLEEILRENLLKLGFHCIILIDMAGNIIAKLDNGKVTYDVQSLASLAAGNFGAECAMAQIIGEKEFNLLFHKGEKENIYFSKVSGDLLLIAIFGHELSLGFIRLKVSGAIKKIVKTLASRHLQR